MGKVNLADKFAKFDDLWTPQLVGELNENYIKLAKGQGELDWHSHDNEDEFFLAATAQISYSPPCACLSCLFRREP